MALQTGRVQAPPKGSRAAYELTYVKARSNLLLAACFTLINVILALTGSNTYFLFSASMPYWAAIFGQVDYEIYGILSYLIVAGVIAVAITALYFLFYLMSKKHREWMDAAAVVFAVDCVGLIALNLYLGFDSSDILDYLFHVYVMYYLISGSISARKVAKMPPEEPIAVGAAVAQTVEEVPVEEAPVVDTAAEEASVEETPVVENIVEAAKDETPAEEMQSVE